MPDSLRWWRKPSYFFPSPLLSSLFIIIIHLSRQLIDGRHYNTIVFIFSDGEPGDGEGGGCPQVDAGASKAVREGPAPRRGRRRYLHCPHPQAHPFQGLHQPLSHPPPPPRLRIPCHLRLHHS